MAKLYYFGYGTNKSRERIREIIGHDPGEGKGAVLDGYVLTYQVLDQVPEGPRTVLGKVWGDEFKGYTLRKGSWKVAGVIWELEEDDLEKIKEWEFVDEHWKEMVSASAVTSDGVTIQVVTEKVPDNQPIKEAVDGLNYKENLNEGKVVSYEEDEFRIAEMRKVRAELEEVNKYYSKS